MQSTASTPAAQLNTNTNTNMIELDEMWCDDGEGSRVKLSNAMVVRVNIPQPLCWNKNCLPELTDLEDRR